MAAPKKPAAKKPAATKTAKPKGKPEPEQAEAGAADTAASAEGAAGKVAAEGDPTTAPEVKADAPTVTDAPGVDHDDKGYIGDKPPGPDDAAYALPSGPSSPSAAESSPQATDG